MFIVFVFTFLSILMTLEQLQASVLAFCDAIDWKQFHSPKDLSCAIAIEA